MGSIRELRIFFDDLKKELKLEKTRSLIFHVATQGKKEKVIVNMAGLSEEYTGKKDNIEKVLEMVYRRHPEIIRIGTSYTYK